MTTRPVATLMNDQLLFNRTFTAIWRMTGVGRKCEYCLLVGNGNLCGIVVLQVAQGNGRYLA